MQPSFFETVKITADASRPAEGGGYILSGASVTLNLPFRPKRFYRHGFHSWSLTAWVDATAPPVPVSIPGLRNKDEDPVYATAGRHTSAWVGAVEKPASSRVEMPASGQVKTSDKEIVLLGALGLAGRVELDGDNLHGFYESGDGDWFLGAGEEGQVLRRYAELLAGRFGRGRAARPPRVWCSWYSLNSFVSESAIEDTLDKLHDLPFDVVQVDDGWQVTAGDWEPNPKFPAGMPVLADKIRRTGRTPGLWLSPFMASRSSSLFLEHPGWLLRDEAGEPVPVGLSWSGVNYALDSAHPEVIEWLEALVQKVRGWGYEYLKIDFLYAGASPGKHFQDVPRETAYRLALSVMRSAAGEAYFLACAAPVIPSLGLCDGMRVGPDVTPYWINTPMSVYLNNPAHPGLRNALRTSLNRLWLAPLLHPDPDAVFFRSRHNGLKPHQMSLQRDLALISGFKTTSDLPGWLKSNEREALREFLESTPQVERLDSSHFRIDGRQVDFSPVLPVPKPVKFPPWLGLVMGLYDMAVYEFIPAYLASRKNR